MTITTAQIDAYLDGTLDVRHGPALSEWVKADRAHARLFAERAFLHARLRDVLHRRELEQLLHPHDANASIATDLFSDAEIMEQVVQQAQRNLERHQRDRASSESTETQSFESSRTPAGSHTTGPRHIVIPKWVAYGAAAAMVVLAVLAFSNRTSPPPSTHPSPATIAGVLRASVDATWEDASDGLAPLPGDELAAKRYRLLRGRAMLDLHGGGSVIVEAPADFALRGPNRLHLSSGRLVGQCKAEADMLIIESDRARIVDRGTEFGVALDPDGELQVHVFEGEVEVTPRSPATDVSPVHIAAGDARAFDRGAAVVRQMNCDRQAFVRQEEFNAQVLAVDSSYHRWLAHSYALQRDPNLVAYWTFERDDQTPDRLVNRAPRTHQHWHGRLGDGANPATAPQWIADRFGRPHAALQFDRLRLTRVTVPAPPQPIGDEGTVAAWIRHTPPYEGGHIFSQLWSQVDGAWHGFQFAAFGPNRAAGPAPGTIQLKMGKPTEYSKRVFQVSDRWRHVAATFTPDGMRFYLDGELVDAIDVPLDDTHRSAELTIGLNPLHLVEESGFTGAIDELLIASRAMTEQEIRQMFQAGRPSSE